MAGHANLSYDEASLRDGEPYLVVVYYEGGMTFVIPHRTLSEAIYLAGGSESIVELAKVEEVAEGVPARKTLAMNVFGVWIISGNQKELTMAKVKNGAARDVANDLLGVTKPRGKKAQEIIAKVKPGRPAKAAAAPAKGPGRAPGKPAFEDHQRIKKVGDRNTRPDSNVGAAIGLLRPNMTFGEFKKAMAKSGNPLPPGSILGFLQKDGVVSVK